MLRNYIIEKQLGKGTYGVVYKVKNKEDNQIYVLKQISLRGLSQKQKDEVKLEAQVLSKIKSQYVVKYYNSFEEEEKLNIIMEYCDSGDLNDFIERHKQTKYLLSENIVWKIFIKITLGLADIHKLNILHRDLKSLNIFLKKDEDIRVGDLGVAKILSQSNYFAKTFIGTPYYLSPEICEDKPYNDKSDVWALGCILYELCTYQHPFTARSQGGLILKILNDHPKPINNYYSKELSDLINLIFDKNYQKRPSCLDILKMKFVIEKAKSLGIYNDIKYSFPEIEKYVENNDNREKSQKSKNNSNNLIKIKPVIIKNNKNESKKRPVSGYGLFGRKGINNKLKFNEIGNDKKKNENSKVLCIDKSENILKKKGFISKNIKIIKKDKNLGKNNIPSKQVRKKAIVSPKKTEKEKIFMKEVEFFNQKRINKIIINDPYNIQNEKNKNNNNDNIKDNLSSILNTKVLNNLVNKNIEHSIFNNEKQNDNINNNKNNNQDSIYNTKDLNNIFNNKDQSIFNNVKINNNNSNEENLVKNTETKIDINKFNYTKDSNKESFIKKEGEKEIINEAKLEENINNASIESDIYKTALKEKYQSIEEVKKEKENKIEQENKKEENEIKKTDFKDTYSSLNFTELIQDFSKKDDTLINAGTKSEFVIENNDENNNEFNIEKNKDINLNIQNLDNNESISNDSYSDNDGKKYHSNDDKYEENESLEEKESDEEKVKEIDDINNIEKEKEKNEMNDELNNLKKRIEDLKKDIPKLIGEEKYKYIMEIFSTGVKDINQEEVSEKIENFIKENSNDKNKEQFYNTISLLFILECQLYNKQKPLFFNSN